MSEASMQQILIKPANAQAKSYCSNNKICKCVRKLNIDPTRAVCYSYDVIHVKGGSIKVND